MKEIKFTNELKNGMIGNVVSDVLYTLNPTKTNKYHIFLCRMGDNQYHLRTCLEKKTGFSIVQGERYTYFEDAKIKFDLYENLRK